MTAYLLKHLKRKIGSFELEPSDGGCFEIQVDGDLIYSKLETGEFPDEAQILEKVSSRVTG